MASCDLVCQWCLGFTITSYLWLLSSALYLESLCHIIFGTIQYWSAFLYHHSTDSLNSTFVITFVLGTLCSLNVRSMVFVNQYYMTCYQWYRHILVSSYHYFQHCLNSIWDGLMSLLVGPTNYAITLYQLINILS